MATKMRPRPVSVAARSAVKAKTRTPPTTFTELELLNEYWMTPPITTEERLRASGRWPAHPLLYPVHVRHRQDFGLFGGSERQGSRHLLRPPARLRKGIGQDSGRTPARLSRRSSKLLNTFLKFAAKNRHSCGGFDPNPYAVAANCQDCDRDLLPHAQFLARLSAQN